MLSCLICDDHALVRDALAGAVARRWPAAEISEAADFAAAWRLAALAPALIIADLVMPGAAPRDGVAGLQAAAPGSPIIVVTGSHDDAILLDLLESGVAGFVSKTSSTEIIIAAIELVLCGGQYLPARLTELALAKRAAPAVAPRQIVTPRQREVLMLIADGRSNKEIARTLGLSPATIKTHVAQAMTAVGAQNRTEAAMRAVALGLL
ncbi:response regulator transcription factor [Sphingomonas sp. AR_OL41]|uniref:LuxR C-terminal-related transcriptional regulator n=1 Tax=Sphingomonas sp. AR_OL41 TaxID=3042729 RepID=UPI0024808973|nr:response regulator transcription factor [Sphingomonas sp. AR_OL41]MDH7972869.1 response regulator transcription factor [Sphingomonas sp. AR_OL41]